MERIPRDVRVASRQATARRKIWETTELAVSGNWNRRVQTKLVEPSGYNDRRNNAETNSTVRNRTALRAKEMLQKVKQERTGLMAYRRTMK
jgi:hypothetical protein